MTRLFPFMTPRDKLLVPMPRPPHPAKAQALLDLNSGDTIAAVSARYGVKAGTVRSWKRALDKGTVTPPANVVALPTRKPADRVKKGGKTKDEARKARKLAEYRANIARAKAETRVAALGPVDRSSVRKVIRRLVRVQETGLWCPNCEPGMVLNLDKDGQPPQFNRLEPKDFLSMTRALHLNLEKLGPLLEAEGRLEEPESTERDADYYEGAEGRAELATDLVRIGPRLLAMVLAENPQTRAIVQAALDHSHRSTG